MDAIREGDLVHMAAVSGSKRRSYYVQARRKLVYYTIAGIVRGDKLVGATWGSVIETRLGRIHLLKPTLAEVMEGFYRRATQVIYPKDLGFIQLLAGLRRGMRVVEAGTGSGFLTTILAIAVCPGGKVYTLDLKRENLEEARRNLELAGVSGGCVEFIEGDVRSHRLPQGLDAGFLDMPDPWAALDNLYSSLKPSAPLLVFVPTYNQVDKLLSRIDNWRWAVTYAGEILERRLEPVPGAVRPEVRMIGFTGFILLLRRLAAKSQ